MESRVHREVPARFGRERPRGAYLMTASTLPKQGAELSHGLNYQKLGKQLMTEDEIAVMDGGKCILQLRGVRPFFRTNST